MTIGKMITWSSFIGYGVYCMTHAETNPGAIFLACCVGLLGVAIDYGRDPDRPEYKDVKRTRKSKGFDKEGFERYQHYLIATNKKRR